jgi:carbon storage regulator
MFIVARRKGQRIVIGNDIEIVVTELSRTTVKLGIVAPKPYSILRGEIRDQIEQVNREALEAAIATGTEQSAKIDSTSMIAADFSSAQSFLGTAVKPSTPVDVNPETLEPQRS